jgi:carbon storage regulator
MRRGVIPWRKLAHIASAQDAQQEGGAMLVLSRKLGEKIYIGENICITVVDIDRGKIRLGIEAPRDVAIYRQELLPLHQQQQLAAVHKQAVAVAT